MIMTQKLFDDGWQKFVVEDAPCSHVPGEPKCLYRDSKGNKCLIGLQIPDDIYSPDMENRDAINLEREFNIVFENAGMANSMQGDLHDSLIYCSQEEREQTYITFATKHDLTIPNNGEF